jgi:hypothetical protein
MHPLFRASAPKLRFQSAEQDVAADGQRKRERGEPCCQAAGTRPANGQLQPAKAE